jgi:hypothetical protein
MEQYSQATEDLFRKAELPWERDKLTGKKPAERPIVSTLAAAIIRGFPGAVVLEELPALKGVSKGRCDLWASIPSESTLDKKFNFYLEAKTSKSLRASGSIFKFLGSKNGVSKLLRDFAKGTNVRLIHRSHYANAENRKHNHYVIGLMVLPLNSKKSNLNEVDDNLKRALKKFSHFEIPSLEPGKRISKRRNLRRFPAVALTVVPKDESRNGMVALFIVFASSFQDKRVDS